MGRRVVVVHDDLSILDSLRTALSDAGFDVTAYWNSITAWGRVCESDAIDLLVARIEVPAGNPHGIALARAAQLHHPKLPVVLMTRSEKLAAEVEDELGHVMVEPLDPDAVMAAVQASLPPEGDGPAAPHGRDPNRAPFWRTWPAIAAISRDRPDRGAAYRLGFLAYGAPFS